MSTQPTADQPLVTHADLPWLTEARKRLAEKSIGCDYLMLNGLDRLIAAAEADKPALPEGWVLHAEGPGHRALWHADGRLYLRSDRIGLAGYVENHRDFLIPLVTAASLVPEGWTVGVDPNDGSSIILTGNGDGILYRTDHMISHGESPAFDVLAALVSAAQAERGESR